ncbi:hypothetical protein MBLNU459_g2970t2 [Dothideomycetes sp. NU459]
MTNLASANRKEWNDRAKSYDVLPWQQRLTAQLTEAIRSRLDWIGAQWASGEKTCSLLDYACGTGMVTRSYGKTNRVTRKKTKTSATFQALQPSITSAHGLDISDAMVAVYNARMASDYDFPQATATLGDLVAAEDPHPPLSDPAHRDYDIAAVGLGFHHFESPELCVERLVERLRPGTGVCLIIDWLPETKGDEGAMEHMRHVIKHHGFDERQMRRIFEGAGLTDFAFVALEQKVVLETKGKTVEKTAFLARGRRA